MDGKTLMGYYWNKDNNKQRVITEIEKEENKNKYPKAYQIIIEQGYKDIDKPLEYIQKVNELGKLINQRDKEYIFSNNESMSSFWSNNNKEKLYEVAQTEEMQERYPVGCKVIIEEYQKYQQKQHKKDLKRTIKLCEENSINVELNQKTIEHIPYEEFVAKINYLNENRVDLIGNNGELHEIFNMCNINMEIKYGISLENLIENYYVLDERKSGL